MPRLVQIIYISRSTFTPKKIANGIESNVARILAKSRANNRRDGLVGVLYFGSGFFFQCLQGEEAAIDRLYGLLKADDRHKDVKLLSRTSIPALTYSDWAMKYALAEKEMPRLLQEGGYEAFDPYKFDDAMVEKVLRLLGASKDPTSAMKAEELVSLAAQAPEAKSPKVWVLAGVVALVVIAAAFAFLR